MDSNSIEVSINATAAGGVPLGSGRTVVSARNRYPFPKTLQKTEPAQDCAGPPPKFNPEAAVAAATRLRNLLKESDGESEDVFKELREALGSEAKPEKLNALAASIRDFDFDGALAKLDEIAAQTHLTEGQTTS
ncbi:MAG: hypothetical protein WBX22_19395 [Silvibacterium sp.]